MVHTLQETIATVRRKARRLTLAHAVSWILTVAILALISLTLLDSYLRFEHWVSRFTFSIVFAVAIEWAVRRFLYRWIEHSPNDVAIAQRIQQCFPQFEGQLASAVEFLQQDETDSRAGSAELRRAVVVDAATKLEQIDADAIFDTRPTRQAMIACAIAAVVVVLWFVFFSATAWKGLSRLAVPWSDAQWPRRHELAFREPPARLAMGSEFEVELFDKNGELPEVVEIEFRLEDESGETRTLREEMQRSGDVMVAHRTNVRRRFSYRATGGDDDTMVWHELEVLEPPRIKSLKLTLTPPEYTLWRPTTSDGQVRALAGTELSLTATSTKPLTQATLRFENGTEVPAELGADGQSISVPKADGEPVVVRESGTYWFELVDQEEMTSGSDTRWRVEAIADTPPSVTVEAPQQDVFVTPQANVPVRTLVKDQLAIRDVSLVYLRSDDSAAGAKRISLYEAPQREQKTEAKNPAVDDIGSLDGEGHRELIAYPWELAKLDPPLAEGTIITVHVEANDFLPQVGQSQPPLRIHVVSREDLEDRLNQRHAAIVREVDRVLKEQRSARRKVADLEQQLKEVGELPQQDLNKLQQADLQQRNLHRSLSLAPDSVLRRIESLLGESKSNNIDNPEATKRLEDLKQLIEELEAAPLQNAERQLTAAIKEGQAHAREQQPSEQQSEQDAPENAKELKESAAADEQERAGDQQSAEEQHPAQEPVEKAGQEQDEIVAKLEGALDNLERWAQFQDLAGDLAALKRQQEDLAKIAAAKGASLLGRDRKDLNRQEANDLRELARHESELRREFDNLVSRMKRAEGTLKETDPEAAEQLSDAVHQARENGISSDMGKAAKNLQDNKVSSATAQQRAIAEKMGEMLDTLSNRGEDQAARRVKKLRKAEKEVRALKARQKGLRKEMEKAAAEQSGQPQADIEKRKQELRRLARKQKQLQEDIQRAMRRLKRLAADKASAKMEQAGGSAGKASQAGEAGDAGEAQQQAAQAEKDLEEAEQEVAKARRQAEIDLAKQILTRIEGEIKAIHERQTMLLEEVRRLATLKEENGRLTRGQKSTVTDLSEEQATLAETTKAYVKDLAAAEAFALALEHAARSMRKAAEGLADVDVGQRTRGRQTMALARLNLLLDALKKGDSEGDQGGGGQSGGEGGGQQQQQGGIRSLAEIKLLRLMQGDLNIRTKELREEIGEAVPSVEQLEQLASLAEEQGELAELTFRLMEEADDAPEDQLIDPQPADDGEDADVDENAEAGEAAGEVDGVAGEIKNEEAAS